MRLNRYIPIALIAVSASLAAVSGGPQSANANEPFARAKLSDAHGMRVGSVSFADDASANATVVVVALRADSGVSPGNFHGLHVHANDVAANGTGCVADHEQPSNTWFVSADGHYKHDVADIHGHHAGDLPSVYVNADGSARLRFVVDKLTPGELAGRAVILHAGADNFANVPLGGAADQYTANAPDATTKTQGTGNAGDRFACGVIS